MVLGRMVGVDGGVGGGWCGRWWWVVMGGVKAGGCSCDWRQPGS